MDKLKLMYEIYGMMQESNVTITELEILQDFVNTAEFWENLNEKQRKILIDSVFECWLDNDFVENNIYSLVCIVCQNIDKIVRNSFDSRYIINMVESEV